MAAFDYVAVDAAGRTVSGALTAADEGAARQALDRRRLMPLEITPTRRTVHKADGKAKAGGRLNAKTLALTTRQLATLVSVAPIEEAVRTIALQADRPAVRAVLEGVHAGVLEGHRLSEAMGRQGKAFPLLYRAMVAPCRSRLSRPTIGSLSIRVSAFSRVAGLRKATAAPPPARTISRMASQPQVCIASDRPITSRVSSGSVWFILSN